MMMGDVDMVMMLQILLTTILYSGAGRCCCQCKCRQAWRGTWRPQRSQTSRSSLCKLKFLTDLPISLYQWTYLAVFSVFSSKQGTKLRHRLHRWVLPPSYWELLASTVQHCLKADGSPWLEGAWPSQTKPTSSAQADCDTDTYWRFSWQNNVVFSPSQLPPSPPSSSLPSSSSSSSLPPSSSFWSYFNFVWGRLARSLMEATKVWTIFHSCERQHRFIIIPNICTAWSCQHRIDVKVKFYCVSFHPLGHLLKRIFWGLDKQLLWL